MTNYGSDTTIKAAKKANKQENTAQIKANSITATLDVIIALIPAAIASIAIFGIRAALVIAVCITSSVAAEYVTRKLMNRSTDIGDLSAVITGLLLAFSLPVSIPLWMCIVGSVVAIVAVKQLFGGMGHNFANPAITARIVLLVSFTSSMTDYTAPARNSIDAISCATPLAKLSEISLTGDISSQISTLTAEGELPTFVNMLFGVRAGSLGEGCAIALILGAVYLILRGVINITAPVSFILTTASVMLVSSDYNITFTAYELLAGGLILGAFFMATDPVTTPKKTVGKLIFGIGCGFITAVIRLYGNLPEGVAYAILLMNIASPLIDRLTASDKNGQPLPTVKEEV